MADVKVPQIMMNQVNRHNRSSFHVESAIALLQFSFLLLHKNTTVESPLIPLLLIITMYHHNILPSQQFEVNRPRSNMYGNPENTQSVDFSKSPNAVTASPSPSSPRVKIANANVHHPHEVDVQEFEAEADYREYIMYQRIMNHRCSRASSLASLPVLIPPALPLSAHLNPSFISHSMIQRLRDNAADRQNSQCDDDDDDNDQVDDSTNNADEEELESEVGIFELDL